MISVIVYGRNDSHGYNLHKRVAISLNCIAETLTHPDDEILFTDYNTPDELPTFIEAIADTLTPRARGMLRVLRVRNALHRRFAPRSHLPVLEPIARNAALRHSNPKNRWVLSTNSDMVLRIDGGAGSLSDVAGELADGFYHTARFELPESLWESFDRREPRAIIDALGDAAPAMHLHEVALGGDNILYDAPGDFQLMLRQDLFDIDGFHEGMILGWHIDSNIAKRLRFLHENVSDLLPRVHAYHCDHTRQATLTHVSDRMENELSAYVDAVERPQLPRQRETWGFAGEEIEEISLEDLPGLRTMRAARAVIGAPQTEMTTAALTREAFNALRYSAAHALPFLLDLFSSYPPGQTIGVFAMSGELAGLFARACATSEIARVEACAEFDWLGGPKGLDLKPRETILAEADCLVFEVSEPETGGSDSALRGGALFAAFEAAVVIERARLREGKPPRRFVCVNGVNNAFELIWREAVAYTHTPFSTRIRHGFVAPLEPPGRKLKAPTPSEAAAIVGMARKSVLTPPREEAEALKRLVHRLPFPASDEDPDWRAAYAALAPLTALVDDEAGRAFLDVDSAKLEALRLTLRRAPTPRPPGRRPPPVRQGRSAARCRFACVEDWEEPRFAGWIARALGGRSRMNWFAREPWVWERAAMMAETEAFLDARRGGRRVLVLCAHPEVMAAYLAAFGYAVDCGDPRVFVDGADAGVDWRPMLKTPEVFADPPLGRFDPDAEALYDAVLLPQNICFVRGGEGIGDVVAASASRVAPGGLLLLSSEVRLLGGEAPESALSSDEAMADALGTAVEKGAPFERLDPFDFSLSAATAARFGRSGDPDAPAPFIRGDQDGAVAALWAWRRNGPDAPNAAEIQNAFGRSVGQRRAAPAGATASAIRRGFVLDQLELAAGATRSPLAIAADPAQASEVFAALDVPVDPGPYELQLEARLRRGAGAGPVLRAAFGGVAEEFDADGIVAGKLRVPFVAARAGAARIELTLLQSVELEILDAAIV